MGQALLHHRDQEGKGGDPESLRVPLAGGGGVPGYTEDSCQLSIARVRPGSLSFTHTHTQTYVFNTCISTCEHSDSSTFYLCSFLLFTAFEVNIPILQMVKQRLRVTRSLLPGHMGIK